MSRIDIIDEVLDINDVLLFDINDELINDDLC